MTDLRIARASAVLVACAGFTGCALFGGGGGEEPAQPEPVVAEPIDRPDDPASSGPADPLAERLLAGDYEGVLAAYAADSTLHHDEEATWRAGLAAAISGHPGSDLRQAQSLFERLVADHPDSERRAEAELLVELISRERELRTTIGRLDRELSQLKAIDLGQQPAADP